MAPGYAGGKTAPFYFNLCPFECSTKGSCRQAKCFDEIHNVMINLDSTFDHANAQTYPRAVGYKTELEKVELPVEREYFDLVEFAIGARFPRAFRGNHDICYKDRDVERAISLV